MHTALIADVAIAFVAQITTPETLEADVLDFVRAHHKAEPLLPGELEVLHWLIAGRIVTGVLIPSWHRARNPGAEHFEPFSVEHIERRLALARRLMTAPAPRP